MRRRNAGYPFPPGIELPWSPGLLHRMRLSCQYRFQRDRSFPADAIQLAPVSGRPIRPLADDDMPLLFLCHNDRRFLPAFFEHYRKMGVTRFICVDDRSTDDTREYLVAQEDADVFESNVRYREAGRGDLWREKLFALYGHDRWYLNVDADEFLVFEGFGRELARDFADRLFLRGIRRLPAVMLDLYPIARLDEAVFDGRDGRMPWEMATHFDGDGYEMRLRTKGISVRGGVRTRVFGIKLQLMKYPLIYWDHRCSLSGSIHWPLPGVFNFAPTMACLLHFKIFSDLRACTQAAVKGGQHYRGAEVYRALQERLSANTDICLEYERSIPYLGPRDLMDRGFILPLEFRFMRSHVA